MAKKFMFICFGILALAAAYSFGARDSVAQVGGGTVVQAFQGSGGLCVVIDNGDIYGRVGQPQSLIGNTMGWTTDGTWNFMGNCFGGGAVNSQGTTIGDVKSLFR